MAWRKPHSAHWPVPYIISCVTNRDALIGRPSPEIISETEWGCRNRNGASVALRLHHLPCIAEPFFLTLPSICLVPAPTSTIYPNSRRIMLAAFLVPVLFALHSLSVTIPPNSNLLQPSSQNDSSLSVTPWPSTPFSFAVDTSVFPLLMTIHEYGSPGPSRVRAHSILQSLAQKVFTGGRPYDLIHNLTETRPGLKVKFTDTGGGYGITRLQALTVIIRLKQFTTTHGAVGVEDSEIGFYGRVSEKFEMVWMFE